MTAYKDANEETDRAAKTPALTTAQVDGALDALRGLRADPTAEARQLLQAVKRGPMHVNCRQVEWRATDLPGAGSVVIDNRCPQCRAVDAFLEGGAR